MAELRHNLPRLRNSSGRRLAGGQSSGAGTTCQGRAVHFARRNESRVWRTTPAGTATGHRPQATAWALRDCVKTGTAPELNSTPGRMQMQT